MDGAGLLLVTSGPNCGYCAPMRKALEAVARQASMTPLHADVGQYNELNPVLAASFGVAEAPMLFAIGADKSVYHYVGERSDKAMAEWVKNYKQGEPCCHAPWRKPKVVASCCRLLTVCCHCCSCVLPAFLLPFMLLSFICAWHHKF